jgi:hypothetical protein
VLEAQVDSFLISVSDPAMALRRLRLVNQVLDMTD